MFVAHDSAGSASCKVQQSWKIACSSEKAKKEITWIYFQQDKPSALSTAAFQPESGQ